MASATAIEELDCECCHTDLGRVVAILGQWHDTRYRGPGWYLTYYESRTGIFDIFGGPWDTEEEAEYVLAEERLEDAS